MTVIITRILEYIETTIQERILSLKILDWFLILLIIGIGTWFGYTIYKDYKTKKETDIGVYRHSGIQIPFEKLEKDEFEISFLGITLESLNQKILSIKNILKKSSVRLLICNPNSPLLPEIEKMVNAMSLQSRIQNTISELNTINNSQDISPQEAKKLELKIYDFIPTHSMIIVESKDDDKNSFIQLEPYSYGLYQEERRIYYISKKKNKKLFESFEKSYDKMWTDSQQLANQTS
jgi:hypothetical protein